MSSNDRKDAVARAALGYIEPGIALGIGTGSTVDRLIAALDSQLNEVVAVVSSSERTTRALTQKGIAVTELGAVGSLDLYIDGADEATPALELIKGGGGALTREKILAGSARKFICIVDDSKLVSRLGTFPLPIEVIPMARHFVARELTSLGGNPVWRESFTTDNGNEILDVHELRIPNPKKMESRINRIPGVVTVGIFAHRPADVLLVGEADGVRTIP